MQPRSGRMVPFRLFFVHHGLFLLERTPSMRAHRVLFFLLVILAFGVSRAARADCTSASCSDCQTNRRGVVSCVAVTYSASCSCSISVNNPGSCTLEGVCTYTGS